MSVEASSRGADSAEAVDPEVLPPEPGPDGGDAPRPVWRRFEDAFGPILAGMIIDTVDVITFGRFGLLAGMVIGGTAAFWIDSIYRLPVWQRFLWALAAGIYCTIPRTEFIPVATLMGAFARFIHGGNR